MKKQLDLEALTKQPVIEVTLAKQSGANRKALIAETNLITKEVGFVVMDELEATSYATLEEAVAIYNRI